MRRKQDFHWQKANGCVRGCQKVLRTALPLRSRQQRFVIRSLFDAIRRFMAQSPPEPPKPEIGFHVKEEFLPYRTKRKPSS